ncbi:hypothetical protein HZ326_22625 [Fusarium oxysporum f. sp. albedinis]|nr:hypothetical protein HZ326_22625 [Fusarium oxysporum f. sp. albedinis]
MSKFSEPRMSPTSFCFCGFPSSEMARPRNSIDQYRDYVTHLYLNGVSRCRIQYKLRKHHHVIVNLSTISRRIASWDLPRQQTRTQESPELIEAIRDLIFRVGLSEKQTLSVLQRRGWPITKEANQASPRPPLDAQNQQ